MLSDEQLDRFPPLLDAITKRVNNAAGSLEGADIDDARTAVAAAWDLLGEVERLKARATRLENAIVFLTDDGGEAILDKIDAAVSGSACEAADTTAGSAP